MKCRPLQAKGAFKDNISVTYGQISNMQRIRRLLVQKRPAINLCQGCGAFRIADNRKDPWFVPQDWDMGFLKAWFSELEPNEQELKELEKVGIKPIYLDDFRLKVWCPMCEEK